MMHQLNEDQKAIFDRVMSAARRVRMETDYKDHEYVDADTMHRSAVPYRMSDNEVHDDLSENGYPFYFVDGPGGTGKTFLYNCLINNLLAEQLEVLPVAYTGIAATLLLNGRTSHSVFKIPIPTLCDSICDVKKNSKQADYLRSVRVIIWDEAPMVSRTILDCVDHLFRDICGMPRVPFAGKVVVLGGDFRQVLPVIRRADKKINFLVRPSNNLPYGSIFIPIILL